MSKKDTAAPVDQAEQAPADSQVVIEAGPVEDPIEPQRPMASIRCIKSSPFGPAGHERSDVPADWVDNAVADGTIELV